MIKVPCVIEKEIKFEDWFRKINIYLPSTYSDNTKLPVIYAYDGNNLYDPSMGLSGYSWDVLNTMESLIKENVTKGYVVVGLYNSKDWLLEYAPVAYKEPYKKFTKNDKNEITGDKTLSFLRVVMDYIEKNYNISSERYIMGSSCGGNMSLYTIIKYSDLFKGAGVFSIASNLLDDSYKEMILKSNLNSNHLIYNYMGSKERNTKESDIINKLLLEKEVVNKYEVGKGMPHSEKAWALYFPNFIRFIEDNKKVVS